MAVRCEGPVKTFLAGEALAAFRRVKISAAGTVSYSGSGEETAGITEAAAANGAQVAVRLPNAEGTFKCEAYGAISAADLVYPYASGRVTSSATGAPFGRANEAAAGTGSVIEVCPVANTDTAAALTSPHITIGLEDANGKETIKTPATASAVNEITVTNSATGNAVAIAATGDDTNIPLTVAAKGSGLILLGQATSTGVKLAADQPILDSAGLELAKFSKASTAVNEVTVGNAATGAAPTLAATGDDTHIPLDLVGKGSGVVRARAMTTKKQTQTATTDTATITIAQMLTGILDGTPTGAATYTLPTAADLVTGIIGARVGDSFEFLINNKSAGANTITVAAGSGGTADGTMTVAQNVIRKFVVLITSVTGSSEAYFVYGLGA